MYMVHEVPDLDLSYTQFLHIFFLNELNYFWRFMGMDKVVLISCIETIKLGLNCQEQKWYTVIRFGNSI